MADKICPYHNKPGKNCSCWCKGCGNLHPDCICKSLKGVIMDEDIDHGRHNSIVDLNLDTRKRR